MLLQPIVTYIGCNNILYYGTDGVAILKQKEKQCIWYEISHAPLVLATNSLSTDGSDKGMFSSGAIQ
jgi:hypothetical protein